MRGLFYKELYTLKSYYKMLISFVAIFSIIGIANQGATSMMAMIFVLVAYMLTVATFSYDEQAKWDRFATTLPINKKDVIKTKYLFYIIISIIGVILSILFCALIQRMYATNINWESIIQTALGAFFGISLVAYIQIPCIIKFGIEKGRMQFIAIIAAAGLLGALGAFIYHTWGSQIEQLMATLKPFLTLIEPIAPFLIVAVSILLCYISYRVSLRLYLKKEM